jgi:hypothetical protein
MIENAHRSMQRPEAIAAALPLAVILTGCAGGGPRAMSSDNKLNGSGSSVPAIDYHAFPCDLQAG